MKKYLMVLDANTSANRAIIFDNDSEIVGVAQKELNQYYPQHGWVEYDAEEIWSKMVQVMKEVLVNTGLSARNISGIGITNQRETTVVWDKETGHPIYNAIAWQSRQSEKIAEKLRGQGLEPEIREKTGLPVDSYFSATKIRWILDHVKGAQERAENGELLFGTIDSWLIWKLTGGRVHITDYSNASRTMLFNINTLEWDDALLGYLNIPKAMLPSVQSSSNVYGETEPSIAGSSILIAAAIGDQQAALFGQNCFEPGMVRNAYGTGGFVNMHTGDTPKKSQHGLITTIAWGIDGKVEYSLEGSFFSAGSAVQWLRDGLRLFDAASDSEWVARKVKSSDGVYVVPAFAGLGAPYWDADARGMIIGITRGTTKAHIVRATLESMAYQTKDIVGSMEADSGMKIKMMRVDGGACSNNLLMQFQADMLRYPVDRPRIIDTAALGAAYLAGLAVGVWHSRDEVRSAWHRDRRFEAEMPEEQAKKLYKGWQKAVFHAMHWLNEED